MPILNFIVPTLCFIAFILLLVVSISAPVVKTVYLFSLSASVLRNSISAQANFGVWGYCIPAYRLAVAGIGRTTPEYCSPPHLGWSFDGTVTEHLGVANTLENIISTTTTLAFVLHPVATILTFLTFLSSLFTLRAKPDSPARIASLFTFGLALLSVFFTTIVFLIDVIVIAIARNKIGDATDGAITLSYGSGVWLTLGATCALWAAMISTCCSFFQRRRRRNKNNTY